MAYRDEADALRAQVAQLRAELAQQKDVIQQLEAASAPDVEQGGANPGQAVVDTTLAFEISPDGLAAIERLLTTRFKQTVDRRDRELRTDTGLTIRCDSGHTRLKWVTAWEARQQGSTYITVVGSAMAALGAAGFANGFHAPKWAIVSLFVATLPASLALLHRWGQRSVQRLDQDVLNAIPVVIDEAHKHRVRRKKRFRKRVRVKRDQPIQTEAPSEETASQLNDSRKRRA